MLLYHFLKSLIVYDVLQTKRKSTPCVVAKTLVQYRSSTYATHMKNDKKTVTAGKLRSRNEMEEFLKDNSNRIDTIKETVLLSSM